MNPNETPKMSDKTDFSKIFRQYLIVLADFLFNETNWTNRVNDLSFNNSCKTNVAVEVFIWIFPL